MLEQGECVLATTTTRGCCLPAEFTTCMLMAVKTFYLTGSGARADIEPQRIPYVDVIVIPATGHFATLAGTCYHGDLDKQAIEIHRVHCLLG